MDLIRSMTYSNLYCYIPSLGEPLVEGVRVFGELLAQLVVLLLAVSLLRQLHVALGYTRQKNLTSVT